MTMTMMRWRNKSFNVVSIDDPLEDTPSVVELKTNIICDRGSLELVGRPGVNILEIYFPP